MNTFMTTYTHFQTHLSIVIELITLYSRRIFGLTKSAEPPFRLQLVPATV
jgi:hypothetical protein